MNAPAGFHEPGSDWRARIRALPPAAALALADRARRAPLFAHAYAFHLNFRFGGMTPADLLDFARAERLSGVKIHVEDGEAASLQAMARDALATFGGGARTLGLEVHIETSTTEAKGLADAVRIAHAVGATSLRFYPRYEGRVSEIIARTVQDLSQLDRLDPDGRLRFMLEQHEDLTSDELLGILRQVDHPRLGLLFDFGNMVNAGETPLTALARQAPHVREVHIKDCLVVPDRGGWAHLACASGQGHLPMRALLTELLLLGAETAQIACFALEEEEDYFAPALRLPSDGPDPFIPARTASYTDPGDGDLSARLAREAAAAHAQVAAVRTMLNDIADAATLAIPETRP